MVLKYLIYKVKKHDPCGMFLCSSIRKSQVIAKLSAVTFYNTIGTFLSSSIQYFRDNCGYLSSLNVFLKICFSSVSLLNC